MHHNILACNWTQNFQCESTWKTLQQNRDADCPCEIECNIEPLGSHRNASIVTTYARYQRVDHHPNKPFIQTWRKKTRIKQRSQHSYLGSNQSHYVTTWVQSAKQQRADGNSSPRAFVQNKNITKLCAYTSLC